MSKDLLKEYISSVILLEDDGGDGGYGGDYSGYGTGVGPGSVQGLKDIFVTPFLDVGKTAAYAVGSISSSAQKAIGVVLGNILSSVVPFWATDYENLKQADRKRQQELLQKYGDVLQSNNKALLTPDGSLVPAMYNLGWWLTYKALNAAPDVALNLINIIGGQNKVISGFTAAVQAQVDQFKSALGTNVKRKGVYDTSGGDWGGGVSDSIVRADNMLSEGVWDSIKSLFKSKGDDIMNAINSSPIAKDMKKQAISLVKQDVEAIVNQVKKDIETKSTERLNKLSGGQFEKQVNKVKPGERQQTAKYVANQLARAAKKFWTDKLQSDMKKVPKDLQRYYKAGIKHIRKL